MSVDDSKENEAASLSTDPIEFKAMTEIAIIAHLADNLFARVLPDGLTVAQFGVLNHLLRLDRRETIGELANVMQVSQPTMSSTVRKLEDKGAVTLNASDHDRRVRHVLITKAGIDLRNNAVANIAPIRDDLMSLLPQSDWKILLPILTRIRVILDEERDG